MTSRMSILLLELLERLEAIEKEHDGLGETNVREQMQQHIFRGYLRPEFGFTPNGTYGLDSIANQRVRMVLDEFCSQAPLAASHDGLTTFRLRLAAFQNSEVRTPTGSDFNDFFGVIDPLAFDENGYVIAQAASPRGAKKIRKLWRFNRRGTITELLTILNESGAWLWNVTGSDEEPWLQTVPSVDSKIQIRDEYEMLNADGSTTPPEYQFVALMEAAPGQLDEIVGTFLDFLKSGGCTAISEGSDYDW